MIVFLNKVLIWFAVALVFSILTPEGEKKKHLGTSTKNAKALILDQIYGSEARISEHYSTLKTINREITQLSETFAAYRTPLLGEHTVIQYEDTLRRLILQRDLLKMKIEFNTNYVKKWKVKLAIHQAEETLLESGAAGIGHDETLQEEGLILRPLAERMELCDSEAEALEIMEELKKNSA